MVFRGAPGALLTPRTLTPQAIGVPAESRNVMIVAIGCNRLQYVVPLSHNKPYSGI